MRLGRDCPAGVVFFSALREGKGLKPSARIAEIGMGPAWRWLREAFMEMRDAGLDIPHVQERLGFTSSLMTGWEAERLRGPRRHYLAKAPDVQAAFWATFGADRDISGAARAAGIARATAYRWMQARFEALRAAGLRVREARGQLHLSAATARTWEGQRRVRVSGQRDAEQRGWQQARAAALLAARARTGGEHQRPPATAREAAVAARQHAYWELVRQGATNTQAARILGVTRRTGQLIRARTRHQTHAAEQAASWSGRYLSLTERLKIADLARAQTSARAIAAELGRAPSTITRELARHRDEQGRYLPHQADAAASEQRRRPRLARIAADAKLRRRIQRKLNCYWSPQQIAGWLAQLHPDQPSARVCTETIYRSLLVPGAQVLAERYRARLRTGRTRRRSRYLTTAGAGSAVQNMTMISDRPAVVTARLQPGHWEGDLILGTGCDSAMITLRERVTHYAMVINLPADHTSATVTAALIDFFTSLPPALARSLTWDQGVEMARHADFTAATAIPVYFAERCSPWQRGANENLNGLLRQYFPKGTDLSVHSPADVAAVTAELNARPRKTLGYRTPASLFRAAARAA